MKIVLDANVLVSGLLSPFGPPAQIVRSVASGAIELYYDARILAEYSDVLLRPHFPFDAPRVAALLEAVRAYGHPVAAVPLTPRLNDPADEPFLEIALTANARCLVTGNLRHFPPSRRQGISVLSPAEFLNLLREEASKGTPD